MNEPPGGAPLGGDDRARLQALLPLPPDDAALLRALPPQRWPSNGVPSAALAEDRERAAALVRQHLSDFVYPQGVRVSVLGPAWSSDIDVHVRALPTQDLLRSLGWLPVGALLRRLGLRGADRWAVIEDGRVLTAVDFHQRPPADVLELVIARCRRRRQVRLREVLELRALVRAGGSLPDRDPVVRTAARIEAGLGGSLLHRWSGGAPTLPPATISILPRAPAFLSRIRRRRLHVAVTGVDGSGKSTLCRALQENLHRAGVPSGIVWTRPGMRLGALELVARVGKRILRQDDAPGVGRVARGDGTSLPSRRGATGRLWALLVTQAFLRDLHRRRRAAEGVVVFDRHLADALVMLDVAYQGVDLRASEALVRRFLPPAAVTLWLDVEPEVAASRKPDDAFGTEFVRRQVERYRLRVREVETLRRLDATRPPRDVAAEALQVVLGLE